MKNQQGQVVLILILVMTVALAIGLSVIQRSLSDVSTSSKVEQSSRAFSAAEAGIEQYLSSGSTDVISFDNNSSATVTLPGSNDGLVPAIPAGFNRQDLMECPPGDSKLAKEDIAQVWLADPSSANNPPVEYYNPLFPNPRELDVYWGNSTSDQAADQAALEVTMVYYDYESNEYKQRKWYLDQIARTPPNGFDVGADCSGTPPVTYSDGITVSSAYQCKYTLGAGPAGSSNAPLPPGLMLLRARLLYNTASQPFAVRAVGTCGQNCSLPRQAKILISTGVSGQTQRKIKVCQLEKVVPPYFDYAIFSAGDINK